MSGSYGVSTKHFRTPSFLQRSTDVPISDNSQKRLANTSAHFKRKTDTNTKETPSSLSNGSFSLFPYLSQLDSFYIARHRFLICSRSHIS